MEEVDRIIVHSLRSIGWFSTDMDGDQLRKKYGSPVDATNGTVIEIHKDTINLKLPAITSAVWIMKWFGEGCNQFSPDVLRAKILRIVKKASTLRRAFLEAYKKEKFVLPEIYVTHTSLQDPRSIPVSAPLKEIQVGQPGQENKRGTPLKKTNSLQHQIMKYERHISVMEKKIKQLKDEFTAENAKRTHYGIRNVKRREERNVVKQKVLRSEKTKYKRLAEQYELKNEQMNRELKEAKVKSGKLEKKVRSQSGKLRRLMREKRIALTRARYHQRRRKMNTGSGLKEDFVPHPQEDDRMIETKTKNGEFTDETRFCVMELIGLEVAAGKVGAVIETVGILCNKKFSALPCKSACLKIVDEGQVLAMTYIRENIIKKCRSFGLHKDGTTRRKVKILDTSISTTEGESFCLGWSSVVSETGQAIADDAKEKLEEVVGTSEEGLKVEVLKKLEYFMSDRAANEKKSDRLLEEWREKMIKEAGEDQDVKEVEHLFCAAHVLLGFHTYVINALKKLDWFPSSDFKHPVVILLKDASDVFGPSGDYRGLRNVWNAFCMKEGKRSLIRSYKDNRFNGLFEVAAQVYHHHQDFLTILESHSTKNAKQTRLYKSLRNPDLILLLECLGLYFHFVTGPFWNMVISPKTSHQNFKIIVKSLHQSLKKCQDDPSFFFKEECFSCMPHSTTSTDTKEQLPRSVSTDKMGKIMASISCGLVATMEAQLKDVLESERDVTVQAPLTNLISERNFGHLDASQKRRPSSSLHHHSSVMLLKQTRKRLREWCNSLDREEKEKLWKKARKESNQLRKKHQARDTKAITDSLRLRSCDKETAPVQVPLKKGEMVAVACQDTWYPAVIEQDCETSQTEVMVSFAELGKQLGSFRWPTGKDKHTVTRNSIIEPNLTFSARAGGRFWSVENAKDIQNKYKKFI